MDGTRGRIRFQRLPDVREQQAARDKDATRLLEPLHLVRQKHETELADDDVERAVVELECLGIGLLPDDARSRNRISRIGDHRFVQIGGDQSRRIRQRFPQAPRHDPRAAGDLEHPQPIARWEPSCEILGVRLEEDGSQIPVVELRDRTRELCGGRHGPAMIRL